MKKIMTMFLVLCAVLMFAGLASAVDYAGFGTWVTATASDAATTTYTAAATTTTGAIEEIIAQDDGNTAAASTIYIWDSTGTTVFTKVWSVGQVMPEVIFELQAIGSSSGMPLKVLECGIRYTGYLYILSSGSVKILKR